jgi:hypothetical protein
MDQLQMFRLNIHLLLGILACLGIGLVLVLAFWTGIRAWLFHKRQEASDGEFRRTKLDAEGRPLPPVGRGICQACGRVSDRVFFLETGAKVCEDCFGESENARK